MEQNEPHHMNGNEALSQKWVIFLVQLYLRFVRSLDPLERYRSCTLIKKFFFAPTPLSSKAVQRLPRRCDHSHRPGHPGARGNCPLLSLTLPEGQGDREGVGQRIRGRELLPTVYHQTQHHCICVRKLRVWRQQ